MRNLQKRWKMLRKKYNMKHFDEDFVKRGGLRIKSVVKQEQEELAQHFNLAWWYGVNCIKCCDVYPVFLTEDNNTGHCCWYQCEVCGRKSLKAVMPHIAVQSWNDNIRLSEGQISLYRFF